MIDDARDRLPRLAGWRNQLRFLGAKPIRGSPAQEILGIDIPAEMVVQIATLRHPVQEHAQIGRILRGLVEQRGDRSFARGGGHFVCQGNPGEKLGRKEQACQRNQLWGRQGPENLCDKLLHPVNPPVMLPCRQFRA